MSEQTTRLESIRALIAAHKRWDLVFAMVGVLALMVGVLTFVALSPARLPAFLRSAIAASCSRSSWWMCPRRR